MRVQDLLSPEGLRRDGRRPQELRRLHWALGHHSSPPADGSVLLELGNTRISCAVYGPQEPSSFSSLVNKNNKNKNNRRLLQAQIQVHLSLSSSSSSSSTRPQGSQGPRKERRLLELQSWIRQTLESVVCLSAYPRSEIQVHLQVLQADGGLLPAGG